MQADLQYSPSENQFILCNITFIYLMNAFSEYFSYV